MVLDKDIYMQRNTRRVVMKYMSYMSSLMDMLGSVWLSVTASVAGNTLASAGVCSWRRWFFSDGGSSELSMFMVDIP